MGVILTSPIPKFPGTVTLPDEWTWEQLIEWEAGISAAAEEKRTVALIAAEGPLVLRMAESFQIAGLPEHPEKFPTRPLTPVAQLIGWLVGEITKRVYGDDEQPNPT